MALTSQLWLVITESQTECLCRREGGGGKGGKVVSIYHVTASSPALCYHGCSD